MNKRNYNPGNLVVCNDGGDRGFSLVRCVRTTRTRLYCERVEGCDAPYIIGSGAFRAVQLAGPYTRIEWCKGTVETVEQYHRAKKVAKLLNDRRIGNNAIRIRADNSAKAEAQARLDALDGVEVQL